jgi:hypothetical protein
MTTEYTTFPIQGRKTSDFTASTVNDDAWLVFWDGVVGNNLKRTNLTDFMNLAAKYLTSEPETLVGSREIGPSDTFVQILASGASPRTVTVYNGVSCFVHNSTGSANTITVEGTALLAGESAFVFWDGTSAHNVVKMTASGGGGSSFITISETDTTDGTYYYYGGVDAYSAWKINRYSKSNLSVTASATIVENATKADLAAAWVDRTTLTYA